MPSPQIDIHPAIRDADLRQQLAESLRTHRLDGKFLYVSPHQTELWRRVFLKHSPIHGKPEFARIYRDAFAVTAASIDHDQIWLIGLGCGTGLKEADLCRRLIAAGKRVSFSAIDVSAELVSEAANKLVEAGATPEKSFVCDLGNFDDIKEWLRETVFDQPGLFTFFGLVPNFSPGLVTRLLKGLLRKADQLLVSAHLAPVGEGMDVPAAMKKVLPQYDNPETLEWLEAALEEWNLSDEYDTPKLTISEIEDIPAFVATAQSRTSAEPLQLFQSLRYTPELFEKVIGEELNLKQLAITACREEAIWLVSKD